MHVGQGLQRAQRRCHHRVGHRPGPGSACSGYLVQGAGKNVVLDLGPGTLANLQQHIDLQEIDAVVLSHSHPDHWIDLTGLETAWTYALQRSLERRLERLDGLIEDVRSGKVTLEGLHAAQRRLQGSLRDLWEEKTADEEQAAADEEQAADGVDAQVAFVPRDVLAGALQLRALRPNIDKLYYRPSGGLSYQDGRGWRAYFGTGQDMHQKLVVYETVVAQLMERGIRPEYISVSNQYKPYYRAVP